MASLVLYAADPRGPRRSIALSVLGWRMRTTARGRCILPPSWDRCISRSTLLRRRGRPGNAALDSPATAALTNMRLQDRLQRFSKTVGNTLGLPGRRRIGRRTQQVRSRPQKLDRPCSMVAELHNQMIQELLVQLVTMHTSCLPVGPELNATVSSMDSNRNGGSTATHQRECSACANLFHDQRIPGAPSWIVTTFCTRASRAPTAPARDGLGLLWCAGCWCPGAPDRRGIPPSPARAAGISRSPGGSVAAPFRAGALRARRLPRAAGLHPAVTGAPPSAGGRACKGGPAVPSRRTSCRRAKITVKGRACGASPMALRATP